MGGYWSVSPSPLGPGKVWEGRLGTCLRRALIDLNFAESGLELFVKRAGLGTSPLSARETGLPVGLKVSLVGSVATTPLERAPVRTC